ncbi:hypothetical protein GOP47_0029794 [Adiantum capillus-veneris]|nr:hypothetical protein GOP47_0029794 [Adiantum capillus-veneris]
MTLASSHLLQAFPCVHPQLHGRVRLSNAQRRYFDRRRGMTCRASWQELAGVLVLSAFPFTVVKAIANSPLGNQLQERMQEYKARSKEVAGEIQSAKRKAREESVWYGKDRPKWLGPIPFQYPDHLTGEAPGDYGFDILGLGSNTDNFNKYFNFEILHARWAMLAALGVVIPEILDRFCNIDFAEPVWWRVGFSKLQGDTLDYLGIPGLHIAGGQGILVIAVFMLQAEQDMCVGTAALTTTKQLSPPGSDQRLCSTPSRQKQRKGDSCRFRPCRNRKEGPLGWRS